MVPWRCSVRTAAPTRGARCGRFNSAHVQYPRPSPHPCPRPIRPAPSHSRRGLKMLCGRVAPLRQNPNPHPCPRPIRPAPSHSRRGLLITSSPTIPHIYCVSAPLPRPIFYLFSRYRPPHASLPLRHGTGARSRKGHPATH